jgi:hypothetical protein
MIIAGGMESTARDEPGDAEAGDVAWDSGV